MSGRKGYPPKLSFAINKSQMRWSTTMKRPIKIMIIGPRSLKTQGKVNVSQWCLWYIGLKLYVHQFWVCVIRDMHIVTLSCVDLLIQFIPHIVLRFARMSSQINVLSSITTTTILLLLLLPPPLSFPPSPTSLLLLPPPPLYSPPPPPPLLSIFQCIF